MTSIVEVKDLTEEEKFEIAEDKRLGIHDEPSEEEPPGSEEAAGQDTPPLAVDDGVKEPEPTAPAVNEDPIGTPPVVPGTPAPGIQEAAPLTQEAYDKLLKDNEDLEKKVKNQNLFRGQQSNKIGVLKREIEEFKANKETFNDEFHEDPLAAQEKLTVHTAAVNQLAQLEAQEVYENNRNVIDINVPDYANYMPDLVKLLEADNIPPAQIESFKQFPYSADPQFVIGLVREVNIQRELTRLRATQGGAQVPGAQVPGQPPIAGIPGQAAQTPKAAPQAPAPQRNRLNAAGGGASVTAGEPEVTLAMIDRMSRPELEAFLKSQAVKAEALSHQ